MNNSVFWDIMLCKSSVFPWTIQCYIPEGRALDSLHCENLKSYILYMVMSLLCMSLKPFFASCLEIFTCIYNASTKI
jgi:hypothetical protein